MKYSLLTFILLISVIFGVNAQNVDFEKDNFPGKKDEFKEAVKNIKEGDKIVGDDFPDYKTAYVYYKKAYNFNENNAVLNYKLGVCQTILKKNQEAIMHFEKARDLDSKVKFDLSYRLAKLYHKDYKFDEAIELFKEFKQGLNPEQLEAYDKKIKKKIKECKQAKELVANPVRVFIDNAGSNINSDHSDYSPIVNADESVLFFTSRRSSSTGGEFDQASGSYFEDIYISEKENRKWAKATNPEKPLNSDLHDAIVGLSPDGQQLFIYKGDEGGDIFVCKLDGDKWTKPKKLSKNINSNFHESHASFSYDNSKIYFVSNKEDGYGEHDIYMSEKDEKGKWQKSINLGSKVNTEYDEATIFAHPDGKTFYFSSKGHNTMGGYDIFKITYENGVWSEVENLGYPINTPGDDVFFSMNASGTHAYFSSSLRDKGLGKQDIYIITFLGPEKKTVNNTEDNLLAIKTDAVSEKVIEEKLEIQTARVTILKGTVKDEYSGDPLFAYIELTDLSTNTIIATFKSNKKSGKYLVSLPSGKNYGIAVKADNCLFHSENIDIADADAEYQEIVKDIELKKIEVGSKVVLKNVFFDTGKSSLRAESETELENLLKLMNDIPTLRLEISGHTDNIGSANFNKKLSKERAKSVVDYLLKNGIVKDRLEFEGYGFDQPLAPNDTEEGRQQNRRTEFKVIGR